ncbi:MAG: ATP-dependent DNA helicase RecG [Robiginitomaculum sp.]|nr:MAG: ATP-dependent DNA helicase RecG [Robiginitomaculum sp.]
MRPEILFPLFAPIETIGGIGPKVAQNLLKLKASRVIDLLFMVPTSVIDRRARPGVANAVNESIASFEVTVEEHTPPPRRGLPYRVRTMEADGPLTLTWFHARPDWLLQQLPVGQTRLVSGKVERFGGELQMLHPDFILKPGNYGEMPPLQPVYPMTAGLASKTLRKAILKALERTPALPEWNSTSLMMTRKWPSWREALDQLHNPTEPLDPDQRDPGRTRLAYDELLSKQLALALVRNRRMSLGGFSQISTGTLVQKVISGAPFTPTGAQLSAFDEISADMAEPVQMSRLLQGDVGSGKTFVAALACAQSVEAGRQAAIMAPTEILARQHGRSLQVLLDPADIRVEVLTGRDTAANRRGILERLQAGEIDVLCGTHALFQKGVEFKQLGLVVVDEQHRFGVSDRVQLLAKGSRPDLLVMTATPIPRTLTLAAFGDMELSQIREKPVGRKPIATRVMPLERMGEVLERLHGLFAKDGRAFWVCPLVEESDKSDLAAAEQRYAELSTIFGSKVGLVHGRMKGAEKERVTEAFRTGEIKLLVATTVVEVGIDAPDATVMVIEHAERFGLAQLHQLRGRVGRSDKPSSCILLYQSPLGLVAKERLQVLRETEDGFLIAEKDAELRGFGDLLGVRQSGQVRSRFADLATDGEMLELARIQARMEVEADPDLDGTRGSILKTLLYLFEQDQALHLLTSG